MRTVKSSPPLNLETNVPSEARQRRERVQERIK